VKVIASRGDGIYLLDRRHGQGQIVHAEAEPPRIWPPQPIDSILKFGYWQEFVDDPAPIVEAVGRAVLVTPGRG
jgi:hypothetical protein